MRCNWCASVRAERSAFVAHMRRLALLIHRFEDCGRELISAHSYWGYASKAHPLAAETRRCLHEK